jgi:hypothetical protein
MHSLSLVSLLSVLEDKLNSNPTVYSPIVLSRSTAIDDLDDDNSPDPIDELEVFEIIRHINDPEHPLTLEQLNVAAIELVHVDNKRSSGSSFIPTQLDRHNSPAYSFKLHNFMQWT